MKCCQGQIQLLKEDPPANVEEAPRSRTVHLSSNSSRISGPGKSSNKVLDYYTKMLGFKVRTDILPNHPQVSSR